ncbi:hypothetical protein, conserved [Plasmodium gonderi]|uniref:Prokaryotic-type class I peptide chain release factors domain-containing protein n=1 Tax=Plasmodium gonderi TaxID=77519 RepID=A0A1Y1J9W1_PLAGO|nr:hypothetical protein, conserved [Plasmodium gonderi]GAW79276.1 hypothetical protein, conserved [Plasmodium gonderi]
MLLCLNFLFFLNLFTLVNTLKCSTKTDKYQSFICIPQRYEGLTKARNLFRLYLNKTSKNKFEIICKKLEDIDIFPKDIEESFIRGTGKGGQKVNKTNNCVMIKYDNSDGEKIIIKCHKYRCLHKNRTYARELLYHKIISIRDKLENKIINQIEKEKRRILKPTDKEKRESINYKKRRSEIKNNRQKCILYEDDIG